MPKLWERDWKFKLVSKMRMEGQNPSKTKKEAWMFDWFIGILWNCIFCLRVFYVL